MGFGNHISWGQKISPRTKILNFGCILESPEKLLIPTDAQATTHISNSSISTSETQASQVIPGGNQSWEPLPLKVAG